MAKTGVFTDTFSIFIILPYHFFSHLSHTSAALPYNKAGLIVGMIPFLVVLILLIVVIYLLYYYR